MGELLASILRRSLLTQAAPAPPLRANPRQRTRCAKLTTVADPSRLPTNITNASAWALLGIVGIGTLIGFRYSSQREHGGAHEHSSRDAGRRLRLTLSTLVAVLDSTDNGIIAYDDSGTIRFSNRVLGDWLHVDPRKLVGQSISTVVRDQIAPVVADSSAILRQLDEATREPERASHFQVIQIRSEYRVLSVYAGPVRANHEIIGRIIVCTDVTAMHRQAEERDAVGRVAEALLHQHTLEGIAAIVAEQAQHALGIHAVGLWLVDEANGVLRLIGERGLPPVLVDDLASLPLTSNLAVAQAVRSGAIIEIPDMEVLDSSDADTRTVLRRAGLRSVCAIPLQSPRGTIGVISFLTAETHQLAPHDRTLTQTLGDLWAVAIEKARLYREATHQAGEASAARTRIAAILESIADAFFALDLDWRFTYINARAGQIFAQHGKLPSDLVGKSIWGEFPNLEERPLGQALRRVRAEGNATSFETQDAHTARWLAGRIYLVNGTLSVFFQDVTSHHEAEIERAGLLAREQAARAEAERARQNLQQFMATIAHDLRGPLTIILGYAQIWARQEHGRSPLIDRRSVAATQHAAESMRRLIDDLLDASRIGAGRFEIRPRPTDLVAVIRQVVSQQQATTTAHRIVVQAPEHLNGTWDAQRLSQLLTNLVSNAIKYSPGGGDVELTVEAMAESVRVCIVDHGIGLSPEHISCLFQPFYQANRQTGLKGTGLGLFIARGIVEAHGGRIWVTSTPGKGSTFCFELPRECRQSQISSHQ